MPDGLFDLVHPKRLTAVIDVGANPIDGDPPYKSLLDKRLCTVIGFEPQADALAVLNAHKSDLETYLPDVLGNGRTGQLRVCCAPGMTSLLRPDPRILGLFRGFPEWGRVVQEIAVSTERLDDITQIGTIDFLKIDAQGSELEIIQNGRQRLSGAVAVHTEVSFLPLYHDQPLFGEIDAELRHLGLVPHAFTALNRRMIAPLFAENNPHAGLNQLLEADIVYVRDFTLPEKMSDEQLKHLALIAHHCYRSYDLTMNCIHQLVARRAVAAEGTARYIDLIKTIH